MSDIRKYRQSSAAALSDMQSSNSSLREKFGRLCRQTDTFTTEHQESYQKRNFDPIQAKKQIKSGSRVVHPSKKATQRKSKKVIESELAPPPKEFAVDKENSQYTNSLPDNLSDAPTAESYMSSVLQSGRAESQNNSTTDYDVYSGTPEHTYSTGSDFSREPATYSEVETSGVQKQRKLKRISEATAKYIEWPLEEHVNHAGPLDHDIITNPNTTSFPADWQSVAHAQMQATAEQMASSKDLGRAPISPVVYARAHSSDTPRFFAWKGMVDEDDEQVRSKKHLTFENSHSEYRDLYNLKEPMQRTTFKGPPKDHDVLRFASTNDTNECDWRSTTQQEMEFAARARAEHPEGDSVAAGLTSDVIAEHLTGRVGPPPAPVFFAWKGATPIDQPEVHSQSQLLPFHKRENVHTETIDSYVNFVGGSKTHRVPPPADHNILENVTDHPTPIIYESVARSQMLETQKAKDAMKSGDVSGSTSELLKKDYRKSYAPGYFAWPVPEQFAEITLESHENVHTEYRDNFLRNDTSCGAERVPPPCDHNVLGCEDNVDPAVWNSTAKAQMVSPAKTAPEKVAGASSAFLAKDDINLCPPGFFAWPVVPQVAQRSLNKDGRNPHSEYSDNFIGTTQRHEIQPRPSDHSVIVECLDADQSAQWQSVAQRQMQEARECAANQEENISLEKAGLDYRHSFAPDYFAWPVKDQRAERSAEATANVHTEYKDNFVNDHAASAIRAPVPEDHIQLGSNSEDCNPTNWKSVASLQNESHEQDMHANGQDVVFKVNQTASSTPSFFVWPKSKQLPEKKTKNARQYGYGDKISSEYDSKFVEIDVKTSRVIPVKVTQTIPVNEVDPSVWKSTTKSAMESSMMLNTDEDYVKSREVNREEVEDNKPMNFAWKPLPVRKKDSTPVSRKGPPLTTEQRTSFIDWNPKIHEMHECHLAEQESNISTLIPQKRRDVKFSGMSETQSRFKAWSPVLPRKATPTKSAPRLTGSTASAASSIQESDTTSKTDEDNVKSLLSHSSSKSGGDVTGNSHGSKRSTTSINKYAATADSAVFSTDSLENRSNATISSVASSRQWHVADDINAKRNTSSLRLREDITSSVKHRPRATSAPTRRRPMNSHQYTDSVNPILRNSRYPGAIAVYQKSARWSTETGSKYTWK